MRTPKVSIIVPVYNVEQYLHRCMDSLLNQTLREIEIIMVDDESPDRCPQLCDEYAKRDSRIKVVHKKNEGLGYARNSGLEVAMGEYVAFVDSDDYVDVNMYATLYEEAYKTNSEITFCGDYRVVNNKIVAQRLFEHKVYKDNDCLNVLRAMIGEGTHTYDQAINFSVWHAIYKKETIDNNKVRFCSERQYISEDLVWHAEFIPFCTNISVVPYCFYYYCMNPGTLTTKYKSGRFEADMIFCNHIRDIVSNNEKLNDDDMMMRVDALVLDKAMSAMSFEVKLNPNSLSEVRKICKDRELQKILHRYPIHVFSYRKRLILNLAKHHCASLINMIFGMLYTLRSLSR